MRLKLLDLLRQLLDRRLVSADPSLQLRLLPLVLGGLGLQPVEPRIRLCQVGRESLLLRVQWARRDTDRSELRSLAGRGRR